MSRTTVKGTIRDSGGSPLNCKLAVTLKSPLTVPGGTDGEIWSTRTRTFDIEDGLVNIPLEETATQGTTYEFNFYIRTEETAYFKADDSPYVGPVHTEDGQTFTGINATVADRVALRVETTATDAPVEVFSFYLPPAGTVNLAEILDKSLENSRFATGYYQDYIATGDQVVSTISSGSSADIAGIRADLTDVTLRTEILEAWRQNTNIGDRLDTLESDASSAAILNRLAVLEDQVAQGTGGSGVAYSQSLPFSTAIKFNRPYTAYTTHSVSSALAFTIDISDAIAGATSRVGLIANGSDVPDLSAYTSWSGSGQYDNRSGVLNVLHFRYDGSKYFVSIGQAIGDPVTPAPDTRAPVLQSAAFNALAYDEIIVTYDEALNENREPALASFAVTGGTPTDIVISGVQFVLGLDEPVAEGQTVTFSYTPPNIGALADPAGNEVAAISTQLTRPAAPPADTQPPTLVSVTLDDSNFQNILIKFSEGLDSSSDPAGSDFTLPNNTITSAAITSSDTVTVTLSQPFAAGTSEDLSYTPGANPIRDAAGNNAAAFTGETIARSGSAFVSFRDFLKSEQTAPGVWKETGASGSSNLPKGASTVETFADGEYLQWEITDVPNNTSTIITFSDTDDQAYQNVDGQTSLCGMAIAGGQTDFRRLPPWGSGTSVGINVSNGDLVRMVHSGDDVVLRRSSDGGQSFTDIYTGTGQLAGAAAPFAKILLGFSSGNKTVGPLTKGSV